VFAGIATPATTLLASMQTMSASYDGIGRAYGTTRRPDPRIADLIRAALGDACSLVNVGAGSGAYEPADLDVIAIEPSTTMIAQRQNRIGRVVQASAEALPLPDKSVDAALAVNTVNHWRSLPTGLAEMQRVARKRIVIFMRDPSVGTPFWLTKRYLPQLDETRLLAGLRRTIEQELGRVAAIPVPLPRDCSDGFLSAFWARPEAYLDSRIRANMSPLARARDNLVAPALQQLERELRDGTWDRLYGQLRDLEQLDLGHRILHAELD
jgi:SAM-dependent methyltransferase